MTTLHYEREQLLLVGREELFAFFAVPENLSRITPPERGFRVVQSSTPAIGEGTVLDYRLSAHGLPLRWRSLISVWEPPHRFVDEMLRGPFRAWVHEHAFEEHPGGTLVRDRVAYRVLGGALADRLFVRSDIQAAFDYRVQALAALFPG